MTTQVTTQRTTQIDERVVELTTGARLRYAIGGPRSEFAVVLIHGWPDSWRSFEPVVNALPPDTPTVAFSLRGFGGSDAPDSGYQPADFASDVLEALDGLRVTSAVVVGHSMGSLVAQRVAVERPDLVAGVVMIGGLSRLAQPVADEVWRVVSDLADPIDEAFVREFQSSTLAEPVPERFFDQLVAESQKAQARVWRAAFAGIMATDHAELVRRIASPTLLIWGDHDALGPRAEQDRLLQWITGAELTVYAGAGHSPNWEQPARVAADIDGFVRRVR